MTDSDKISFEAELKTPHRTKYCRFSGTLDKDDVEMFLEDFEILYKWYKKIEPEKEKSLEV